MGNIGMSSTDTWFQNAFVAFAIVYIFLAIVRIAVQWKNTNALVKLKLSQDQKLKDANEKSKTMLELVDERAEQNRETIRRARENQERADEAWQRNEKRDARWEQILSRIESLLATAEDRNGT